MFERIVGAGWGSVEIFAPGIAYEMGSLVDGRVSVNAKRDLGPGRLTVALVCVRREVRTIPPILSKRIQRERTSTEVWRATVDLDADLTLTAGTSAEHPFELRLPTSDTDADDVVPEWARGTIAVIKTVTFATSTLQWQLRAKFQHPDGFDLRRNQSVLVNP